MEKQNWMEKLEAWNKEFRKSGAEKMLEFFLEYFNREELVLASSFGAEDQVLIDMISERKKGVRVVTLDTGRIFPETYELMEISRKKYPVSLEVYFPDTLNVEKMVKEKGLNLFYESVENRKYCCRIRKNEPLTRALKGAKAWISGLRRDQSVTRISVMPVEWDDRNNLIKINPLYDWTEAQVWRYIRDRKVPYNVLHDQNFPSIGCQPCTRAVQAGESLRSGRWWWELPENRECGLHVPE